jgi:hypothetical protein
MKKLFIVMLMFAGFAGAIYGSLENVATMGLFYNELDDISDPMDIFRVEKNVTDLAFQGWSSGWGVGAISGGVGLVDVLPFRVGLVVDYNENMALGREWENQWRRQGILGPPIDITSHTYTTNEGGEWGNYSSRNVLGVIGLNLANPIGVSYQYFSVGNLERGTINPATWWAAEASDVLVTDGDGEFTGRNVTEYADGFVDDRYILHQLTPAIKLNNLMLYFGLGFSSQNLTYDVAITGNRFAERTVSSYIPDDGSQFEDSHTTTTRIRNAKGNVLSIAPGVRYILVDDGDNYGEFAGGISFGIGFRPAVFSQEIGHTFTAVPDTSESHQYTTNTSYMYNFSYMPINLVISPYFNRKLTEKVNFGYGIEFIGNMTFEGYTTHSTNVNNERYIEEGNDAASYWRKLSSWDNTYDEVNKFNWDWRIALPLAVQVAINETFTLRFGSKVGYRMTTANTTTTTKSIIGNIDKGDTIVYDDATETEIAEPTENNFPWDEIENITTVTTYRTLYAFSTGLGVKFSENFYMDLLFSGGNILDSASWGVELRYLF